MRGKLALERAAGWLNAGTKTARSYLADSARSQPLLLANVVSLIAARLNQDATATAIASNCLESVFASLGGTGTSRV